MHSTLFLSFSVMSPTAAVMIKKVKKKEHLLRLKTCKLNKEMAFFRQKVACKCFSFSSNYFLSIPNPNLGIRVSFVLPNLWTLPQLQWSSHTSLGSAVLTFCVNSRRFVFKAELLLSVWITIDGELANCGCGFFASSPVWMGLMVLMGCGEERREQGGSQDQQVLTRLQLKLWQQVGTQRQINFVLLCVRQTGKTYGI